MRGPAAALRSRTVADCTGHVIGFAAGFLAFTLLVLTGAALPVAATAVILGPVAIGLPVTAAVRRRMPEA